MAKSTELTAKEQKLIDAYCDPTADTYQTVGKSYIAAGYSQFTGWEHQASKVINKPHIQTAIAGKLAAIRQKTEHKQLITLDRLDSELFDLLNKCKNENDRTNAVATLRLIGQRVSAYTDKQQVTQIDKPDMTQHDEQELAKLARDYNIKLASG